VGVASKNIHLNRADAAVAEALTDQLANQHRAQVIAWPVVVRYQNTNNDVRALAAKLQARTLAVVLIRDIAGSRVVSVFLVDGTTGQKHQAVVFKWRSTMSTVESQQAVVRTIAEELTL